MMAVEYTPDELAFMERNTVRLPVASESAASSTPATSQPPRSRRQYINPDSQNGRVLAHLKAHGLITNVHAVNEMKILRLSERIRELKAAGYQIETIKKSPEVWVYKYTGHQDDRRAA